MLQGSGSNSKLDYQSLVDSRLPSPAELEGATLQEQEDEGEEQQPSGRRAIVTAADGIAGNAQGRSARPGGAAQQAEGALQEVQHAMPDLLRGAAVMVMHGGCCCWQEG